MYQMTDEDLRQAIEVSVHKARKKARKCALGDGHFEDMIQQALERILRYAPRFNKDRGVKFRTYASVQAACAILDYMRELDPMSRNERDQIKVNGFAKIHGKVVLDMKPVEIEKAYHVSTELIDDIVPDLKFEVLNDKELIAVTLFLDGFTMRQIGEVLSVTEGRVSQIVQKACDKLKRAAEGKRVDKPQRSARAESEGERLVRESIYQARRKYGSNYYRA